MSELLEQFNKEYKFLYDNKDNVSGYDEALTWFNNNSQKLDVEEQLTNLINERNDFVSSDREAVAFAFACEMLNIG